MNSNLPIEITTARTVRHLIKQIFDAESPEKIVAALPPQTLFLCIKEQGIHSATELIEMATLAQTRVLLDFDLWQKDSFREDEFFEWLSLAEDTGSVDIIRKILRTVDLKLVALLLARHVLVTIFEEPTDNPPGPHWYTPDNGFTWLTVETENSHHHFLLTRLLAVIFDTDRELFYQIIAVPGVATETILEEESFQDKTKRLQAEGVPDFELAEEIHVPLTIQELLDLEPRTNFKAILHEIPGVTLFLKTRNSSFDRLLQQGLNQQEVIQELTFITNGALIRWGRDGFDTEVLFQTAQEVQGAISIGIDLAERAELSPASLFERFGLRGFYQVGLGELLNARKKCMQMSKESLENIAEDPKLLSLVAGLRETIPQLSLLWSQEGADKEDVSGFRAFVSLHELQGAVEAAVSCA